MTRARGGKKKPAVKQAKLSNKSQEEDDKV